MMGAVSLVWTGAVETSEEIDICVGNRGVMGSRIVDPISSRISSTFDKAVYTTQISFV